MERLWREQTAGTAFAGLLSLATLLAPTPAQADEPLLAIRLSAGESALYAIGDIERIGFEGAGTLVITTLNATDSFPAESILRIEFLWDFSSTGDPRDMAALIGAIHLSQNLPNPFSPETRIGFELPQGGHVVLGIHSADGRLVRMLVNAERPAGHHEVRWDGLCDTGRKAPGGVYFCSLRAPGIDESRRMILLP